MAGCLFELQDEDERWMVGCGSLHSFVGNVIFLFVDAAVVGVALFVYLSHVSSGPHWSNILPVVALFASLPFVAWGGFALFKHKSKYLQIYAWRCLAVAVFSFVWMFACFFGSTGGLGVLVSLLWLVATIMYLIGYYVSTKTVTYFHVRFQ